MTQASFWANYKASPVKENRFGIIPVGEHTVKVIDVQEIPAGCDFRLDDNGKVIDVVEKDDFVKEFDQPVCVLVYQNAEGQVLIDRRHSKGWLTSYDKDGKGQLIASPDVIAKYGLVPAGSRFLFNGLGKESKAKTLVCAQIMDRMCAGVEVENPFKAIGKHLDIQVAGSTYEGKTTNEVVGYAKAGVGFKTKGVATTTPTKETVKVTEPIQSLTPVIDDLPF